MACFWPNRIWQRSWAITASTTAGPTIQREASNCVSVFCSSRSFGWRPLTRAGCPWKSKSMRRFFSMA